MSSMFGFDEGAIQSTTPVLLPTTAEIDLLTPGRDNLGGSGLVINFVNFAVGTASAVSLKVYDGTTSYFLVNTKAIGANDVYVYEFPFLLPFGWTLRAQTSVALQVTVTVTYVALPKAGGLR